MQGSRLHGLDLFSGIAGNSLGLGDYIKTVAYCEANRHAQAVLLSRMAEGDLECAPIWDDVRTLNRGCFDIPIDIIVAGFPCQDISVAGKGAGLEGERSGLFFQILRLAEEIKPSFLFLENVPAIRTRGLDRVGQELAALRYDCRWGVISAYDVGAPHRRERWFLLAHRNSEYIRDKQESRTECFGASRGSLANSDFKGLEELSAWQSKKQSPTFRTSKWESEPNVGRVVNGLSFRVDRIKRLGNAVVPLQAKTAFERLLGIRSQARD